MKRILCLLLSALLLCGCSSATKPYTPTGDGLTWEDDYTGPVYTKPQQDNDQSLVLAYYPDISMNPYVCTDFTNRALFSLIYQSLFVTDRNYTPEPQLCKTYSYTEDLKTYTFQLESATFSDGTALTPQDVAASLLAAKESPVYSGRFRHFQEISASGNDVVIQLTTPMEQESLLLLLDIPILKASQLTLDQPLGTGPYVLTGASLHRRADWWCHADMAITADTIALMAAESVTHIRDQFEFSDLSLVCADTGSDNYADYRCDFELWDCENGIFLYLTTCAASEVFSDPEVRAALTYAIDRDMLVEEYYRGFARSTTLPASPQFPFYSDSLAAKYSYDAVKFARLINEKGMKDSPIILLVNKDDSLRLRVARAIAQMLEDCGLAVELLAQSGDDYLFTLQAWNFDLYLGQTKLSPNMDLSAFFSSSGALSYGGVNDVAANTLNQQALENHGNYYTLHKTVMDNGLLCPILTRSYAIYATRGLLTDLTPSRDCVFYYSLGKTLQKAHVSQ